MDDGYGKRYLLGPTNLLLGEIAGAVQHYQWYEKNYSDDIGDPYDQLCRARL